MSEDKEYTGISIKDVRMSRPIIVRVKSDRKDIVLQITETFEISNKKISFYSPNNISICLNKSKKESQLAQNIYSELLKPKFIQEDKIEFSEDDIVKLYDYFEHIESAIIFIYTAVEAFSNVAIPKDHIIEKYNTKGIKEVWDKSSIERWLTTSEKIKNIVPEILEMESPKTAKFWSNFTKLEKIRNEIIHQKTADRDTLDMKVLEEFLNKDIFKIIYSGFEVISFFCEKENKNAFFPMGFGKAEPAIIEIDKFEEYFEVIEE